MCTRFIKCLFSFYTEWRIAPLVATYASWIKFLLFRNKFFIRKICVFYFTDVMTLYTLRIYLQCHCFVPPHVQLQSMGLELGVYLMSVFQLSGVLLNYIWIYACVLIPKRKTIFSFNFLLACLNWFENNHWNTSLCHEK